MGQCKKVIRPEKVNSKGECVVFIKYTHKSKNKYFSTGQKVSIKDWDRLNNRVKKSYRGFNKLNDLIDQFFHDINGVKLDLILKKKEPTISRVNEEYHKRYSAKDDESEIGFWESLEEYRQNRSKEIRNTYKEFGSFYNAIMEYGKHSNTELTFHDIDMKFYESFVDYLYDVRDNLTNTVGTRIKNLKAFMNWAEKNGHHNNRHYKLFKKPSAPTNIIALTKDEFKQFNDYQFKNSKLEKARDLFIFSCCTGLRYSDYSGLKKISFNRGEIVGVTKKTMDPFNLPINDFAKAILEKYDFQLPKLSSQKLNEYLKEAAKEANLDREIELHSYTRNKRKTKVKKLHEAISSHMGRKTFVTLCLELGMPDKDVMAMSKHSSYASFQVYKDTSNHRIREDFISKWKF